MKLSNKKKASFVKIQGYGADYSGDLQHDVFTLKLLDEIKKKIPAKAPAKEILRIILSPKFQVKNDVLKSINENIRPVTLPLTANQRKLLDPSFLTISDSLDIYVRVNSAD